MIPSFALLALSPARADGSEVSSLKAGFGAVAIPRQGKLTENPTVSSCPRNPPRPFWGLP